MTLSSRTIPPGSNSRSLVTVITPTYNHAAFLGETIESVLSQNYPELEYIVLDDGSTDNTADVLARYGGRLRVVRQSNMGEALTVNRGLAMAHGEFLTVVNSDDPLRAGSIQAAVEYLQLNPRVVAVYPDWDEIGPQSECIQRVCLPDFDITGMLTVFNIGMGPGTFVRRSVLARVGLRDPQFRYAADIDLWLRLALTGPLGHIRRPFATHRRHPGGISISERGARMADELVRVVNKTLANPEMPLLLQRHRQRILGHAHWVAAHHCGAAHSAATRHIVAAHVLDPLGSTSLTAAAIARIVRRVVVSAVRSCMHFLPRGTKAWLAMNPLGSRLLGRGLGRQGN